MSEDPEPEVTREGLIEIFVGKTKEAAGELVGNDKLAESGREQQEKATEEGADAGSAGGRDG